MSSGKFKIVGRASAVRFVASSIVFFVASILSLILGKNVLSFSGGEPAWELKDMDAVFIASSCFDNLGLGVYEIPYAVTQNGCERYLYGTSSLKLFDLFQTIGLDSASLRILLIAAISVLFASYFKDEQWKFGSRISLLFVLALLPPSILLVVRLNLDSAIFVLSAVGALLSIRGGALGIAGFFLFALGATFKFYSLPVLLLLLVLAWKSSTWLERMVRLGMSLAAFLLVLRDLTLILPLPESTSQGFRQWGAGTLGHYVNYGLGTSLDLRSSQLLGVIIIVVPALIWAARYRSWSNLSLVPEPVIVISSVHVICFIAGLNYDSRLIFFVLSFPVLLKSIALPLLRKWLWLSFFCSLLLTYQPGLGLMEAEGLTNAFLIASILEGIGDLSLFVCTAFMLATSILWSREKLGLSKNNGLSND